MKATDSIGGHNMHAFTTKIHGTSLGLASVFVTLGAVSSAAFAADNPTTHTNIRHSTANASSDMSNSSTVLSNNEFTSQDQAGTAGGSTHSVTTATSQSGDGATKMSVTVNGQSVPIPQNGIVQKIITSDDGQQTNVTVTASHASTASSVDTTVTQPDDADPVQPSDNMNVDQTIPPAELDGQ